MNILFSTVGRRGYIVDFFKEHLTEESKLIGTSDRDDCDLKFTPGFFHCDKNYPLPSIKHGNEYIEALQKICENEAVDMFFHSTITTATSYLNICQRFKPSVSNP